MKKCVMIVNPESGKRKRKYSFQDVYDVLRKYGYDTEIFFTKCAGDALRIVKSLDDSIDLVISAGGDGTLHEVVTGNMQRKKKIAVAPLPLGSTNDVGKMYGLNKGYIENLEKILTGQKKLVDICYINNSPFVYVACFGDYTDMAYSTPRKLKKRYGKIAYIMYGLRQLRNRIRNYNIKYEIDGKQYNGCFSFMFITNSSRIAGQSFIYNDVKLNDKMFEVAFANVKTKKEMLKLLVLISTMNIKDVPGITYYQTDNLIIEFLDSPKSSWCIDGEEYKANLSRYEFSLEQNMYMLVPKEKIDVLFE